MVLCDFLSLRGGEMTKANRKELKRIAVIFYLARALHRLGFIDSMLSEEAYGDFRASLDIYWKK